MEFPNHEQKISHNSSDKKTTIPLIGSMLLDTLHQYNESFTPAYYILEITIIGMQDILQLLVAQYLKMAVKST